MSLRPSHIHGAIINHSELAGFVFTETVYTPQFEIASHFHTRACFYTVLEGKCTESFEKTTIESDRHAMVFRPAGEPHSNKVGNVATRCFLIEVENQWLEQIREYASFLNDPVTVQNNSLTNIAMRLRREVRHPDPITPLAIEGLLLEIIAEACRKRTRSSGLQPPRWLERTREMLHERFLEPLTLSEIAGIVGVHPVYLASVFRRYFQCSLGEYRRQLRVEFTCAEIAKTDTPLSQIALAAGYSDQAHFSRTFKRLTGMTPTEYRANSRNT